MIVFDGVPPPEKENEKIKRASLKSKSLQKFQELMESNDQTQAALALKSSQTLTEEDTDLLKQMLQFLGQSYFESS